MASTTGPLAPETLDEIIARLEDLDRVQLEIEKAKRAGIDVASHAAQVAELRVKLQRVRQTYFPGK